MLSNTLSVIETTIQHKLNNDVDITALIDFFRCYKVNMWIYPGVLKRKFSLSLSDIYELYCSNCQKSMGIVRLFNELPDSFECELCHCELPALENSFLIYKVIRDD